MNLEEYLLLAIGAILLFIIYYITSRDAQTARQVRSVASALEDLNRQLFNVEKSLKKRIEEVAASQPQIDEGAILRGVEARIDNVAQTVAQTLENVEQDLGHHSQEMSKRISQVEEGLRQLSMPASISGMDDEKIIALYKQGVDLDTIARELRLSKAEVEFVLKINKIR